MADETPKPIPSRTKARTIIRVRPRVTPLASLALAAVFALLATPIVLLDSWAQSDLTAGEPAPVTVRIPQFAGFGPEGSPDRLQGGGVVVARGQVVDEATAQLASRIRAEHPTGGDAFLAVLAGLFLIGLLYSTHMRRSHTGRLLRVQIATLGLLVVAAAAVQLALILSPMSIFVVPVAGIAIIAALAIDISVGLATGLAGAMLMAFLVPFDAGTVAVLAIQAFAGVLSISGRKNKPSSIIAASTIGGLAAATAYFVFYFLGTHTTPMSELQDPLRSAWVASLAGGLISGLLGVPAQPVYQFLMGEITKSKLVELEDLSNPLLKQIAEKSPGTWQHSLAMANMAEIAANTIGANGRLVRVGAYYHDLGKSLQAPYFIENLRGGESSPHDRLPPEVSCDAIFAHVTEGVRVGRKEGLPERIIDFMHMHHGDGLLEYFWAKCEEQGNPKNLTQEDFRYPGVKPQTCETAILAICDAVEAASRTLRNPDENSIRTLVQRIVYGKLHLGQLDESGLTVADLRRIANSLEETIKHAFHGRIEYPWQRKAREEEAASSTAQERPRAPSELAVQASAPPVRAATHRFMAEPRLDSLDAPRPYWSGSRLPTSSSQSSNSIEIAATERVDSQNDAHNDTPVPGPETARVNAAATAAKAEAATRQSTPRADTEPEPVVEVDEGAEVSAQPESSDGTETVLLLSKRKAETDGEAPERQPASATEPAPPPEQALEPASPTELMPPAELAVWNDALNAAAKPAPAVQQAAHPQRSPSEARAESKQPVPVTVSDDAPTRVRARPASDDSPTQVRDRKAPPPPPGARTPGRRTIPLLGESDDNDDKKNGEAEPSRPATRAESEDDTLTPGVMVLGPPPATHKKKRGGE